MLRASPAVSAYCDRRYRNGKCCAARWNSLPWAILRIPPVDVGPVIDAGAKQQLGGQIADLDRRARLVARLKTSTRLDGNYVAPCIYEIDAVEAANEEIFGPVLQVVRWTGEPEALVARINKLGYGLTLGIQTRVDGRAQRIAECARVGNVYINRSMIGAIVGVQPFGGEGLSGTGPKAGGPHYLARFCVEQTVTTNTAAAAEMSHCCRRPHESTTLSERPRLFVNTKKVPRMDKAMNQMNGAEAAVRMLQENGVRHIFGLCGEQACRFMMRSINSTTA